MITEERIVGCILAACLGIFLFAMWCLNGVVDCEIKVRRLDRDYQEESLERARRFLDKVIKEKRERDEWVRDGRPIA